MKKIYFIATLVTLISLLGCSKSIESEGGDITVAQSELSIGLPVEINRTATDAEGNASWCDGDTFALWAENRTGGFNLNGVEFTMMYYWHSMQSAVFTSGASSLSEGTYTYYAVSPMPESISNRKATFTIPAVQQGNSFNGAYDIMVAEPLDAAAIVSDKVNNLALDFKHKMHTLKIEIAKNTFGLDISKLVLTFTTEVTGTVMVDATNADSAPALTNGSKTLTLNFDTPINEGDTAWGVICPANVTEVQIMAYATDGTESVGKTISLNKECEEGHITPLYFTTTQINPPTLRFSMGKNNLGEAIKRWAILDQNGNTLLQWEANSGNLYTYSFNGSITASGLKQYAGKTLVAQFESEHAIVKRDFTMPSTISNTTTTIPAIDIPYLFFEDFTSIQENFEKDDKRVDNLMSAEGMLLNKYMSVSGWNGAHIKGVAGKSVRVNTRHQSFMGATRSNGRIDSPAMKNLKAGANVRLKVEFDMGAYANSGYSKNNDIFCIAGMHTAAESTVLNGIDATTVAGEDIHDDKRVPKMFNSVCLQTGYITQTCNDNSFGVTLPTYSFVANGCTSATRFSWVPCCIQQNWGSGNAHYYIYLDNIRVSIAQ
ncbi:MAG: fimbrillin family protein [Rikenellaceae bacterium]|nr:fimbrillin family protein [Rikenellaceae bacterium]